MSAYTKITVNERCTIEADAHNWNVHYDPEGIKQVPTKKTTKAGEAISRYSGRTKYTNTLAGALEIFADLELKHQGEASNLFDLINQVKKLESGIKSLLRDQVAI